MAFQFRAEDKRGQPKIQFFAGEFVALGEYFTGIKRMAAAQKLCREINRRIPSSIKGQPQ